ncbi:MAG: deoxyribonuclease IV [Nitrospinae bacterium]|nr:deoxyribonuclease IV [Nitrospinota bacterium]
MGAHMSIAGGVATAPARAVAVGANTIQIFTRNNTQWKTKPLTGEEALLFAENARRTGVSVFAVHSCYLINLASPDKEILSKSREAFIDEMDRADALDIPCLVFHPGAHMGAGEEKGIQRIADSLNWALDKRPRSKVTLTLETTAGQGTSLGHRFDQLAAILEKMAPPERLAICVDTCHIFAAGYDISAEAGYNETFRSFDSTLGAGRIKLFHVNDSKTPLNSRVDRHEHIGKGKIGLEGFRLLMNDQRFVNTPMILETPKGPDGKEDIVNLKTLRKLTGRRN